MKIQLKRSNVLDSGAAKQPTAAQMEFGELAVNYNESDPAIFLKDSNNNIIRIAGDGAVDIPLATETEPGIAEIATQAETDAGVDDQRIVTPLKLGNYVSNNLWIDGGSAVSNFGSAPAIIDGGAAA